MASTAASLIQRVRRRVRDWPEADTITASMSSSATTVTVTDVDATYGPRYTINHLIEIDTETMRIRDVNTGTNTLTLLRAVLGSTAATHTSGTRLLYNPHYPWVEILDLLNDGLDSLWPRFYQEVDDATSLTATSDDYDYTIPNVTGLSIPIPRIRKVLVRPPGFTEWHDTRRFEIIRGGTPQLRMLTNLSDNTEIRLLGYAPLPHLASGDSTHAQLPYHADNLAVDWAVSVLLYEGESGRVRFDEGPIDDREQANQAGAALRIAREWERRFYQRRDEQAMPPMEPHIMVSM